MSAPPGPKFDAVMQSAAVQELLKQRPDVPTEKPKVQKTVEELEGDRRALEIACKTFAGADGKGGTIAELTEIVASEEKEEAELVELLGANAELDVELAPAREARAEDRKQIERLKRAYDTLLQEIAALNKQIREAREAQVKEGKEEVAKEAEVIEDLTEHAVMEPPPVPFAARDASLKVEEQRQAALAEAPDLTEYAVLQPPPIPQAVREASMKRHAERQAAQESSGGKASHETSFAAAEATTTPAKETPPVDTPKATPEKPEPAAKNEKGPENTAQAQALIAEQQREQMEIRQRLLALYKTYKEELLPQTQAVYEAAQFLGGLGAVTTPGAEKAGPFASLQLGAKMQLDDARSLQGLFAGLQSEAMKNTPKDIEAATRDVQLVTARLQMRMQGLQGYRNTILGLRASIPRGSAREHALLALDAVAGNAWKAAGKMQAEWQPIGSKIQARNGREHHKLYEQAYGSIVGAQAKGEDVKLEVPDDVLKGMPTEVIPAGEDLSRLKPHAIAVDLSAIAAELQSDSASQQSTEKPKDQKDQSMEVGHELGKEQEFLRQSMDRVKAQYQEANKVIDTMAQDAMRGRDSQIWQVWTGKPSRSQESVMAAAPLFQQIGSDLDRLQAHMAKGPALEGDNFSANNENWIRQFRQLLQSMMDQVEEVNRVLNQPTDQPTFGQAMLRAVEALVPLEPEFVQYIEQIAKSPIELVKSLRDIESDLRSYETVTSQMGKSPAKPDIPRITI